MEDATAAVMGFANLVDTLFVRYTGRTVQELLRESAQRPRELPAGEKTSPIEVEPGQVAVVFLHVVQGSVWL